MTIKARRIGRRPVLSAATAILIWTGPAVSRAEPIVAAGFDLFETVEGTMFRGIAFRGVPLGSFDFGSGLVQVGATDTIVQRLDAVSAPSGTTALVLRALQLVTTTEMDLGLGTDFYYATLRSGTPSGGSMTIMFGSEPGLPPPPQPVHGTFDSLLTVNFDLRKGSLTGDIVPSPPLSLTLRATGFEWSHLPPPESLEIRDVNAFLNGTDRGRDFFPVNAVASDDRCGRPLSEEEITADIERHRVCAAPVPEPASLLLLSAGLAVLGRQLRRRARP